MRDNIYNRKSNRPSGNTLPGSPIGLPVRVSLHLDKTKTNAGIPDITRENRKLLIDAFLAAQDVKDSSLKTYRQSLEQYFHWLDSQGKILGALTEADIVEYKKQLLKSGHKALTVRSYLVAVRKFYTWAEGMKLYQNIASGVKSPKVNQGGAKDHFIKMHLTEAQASALLEYFAPHPRNYAIVNLMLRTGLRSIEVSRARIQDITMRSGQRILHVWGKGMDAPDPSVFVVLTDVAYAPIRAYLQTRPGALPGEPLFVTEGTGSNISKNPDGTTEVRKHTGEEMSTRLIQMIVKKGLRAIGLDDHAYSTHSLRHTTGTQLIRSGASILDVQRTLRHSSVNTSMIYIASIQEEEHLRNAPEALLDTAFK